LTIAGLHSQEKANVNNMDTTPLPEMDLNFCFQAWCACVTVAGIAPGLGGRALMSSPNGHTPMIGELLAELFGEAVLGRLGRSRQAQLIARLCFGLLGTGLCGFGAIHFMLKADLTNNVAMRGSMVAVFVFLACFSLFNVALARKWHWPLLLFIVSFVALFISRILFGA
jgi:hypothetical protein